MQLDPDQVIINRRELARLHAIERQLSDLRGRMEFEERYIVERQTNAGGIVFLKTKDGLMAQHRLPNGHPVQVPVKLPLSKLPSRGIDFYLAVSDTVSVRTYHFAGFLGRDRTPVYEEK